MVKLNCTQVPDNADNAEQAGEEGGRRPAQPEMPQIPALPRMRSVVSTMPLHTWIHFNEMMMRLTMDL